MEKNKTKFQQYKDAREEMLSDMTDFERQRVELHIKEHFYNYFKNNAGNFFKYEIFDHPLIEKYFKIWITTGDRNIGKTYSAKMLCRKFVGQGKKFEWMRNNQTEIEELIVSEQNDWFEQMGWKYDNKKSPNIYNINEKLVGYYRDVNTVAKFKSVEFKGVEIMVWDEFNSDVSIKNKFNKFVEHVVTVQRHRPNLKIILQSNYIDQNDSILQELGVGLENLNQTLFFNWISGVIMVFIPRGIFKSVGKDIKSKKRHLGYALSLNSFDTYQRQFGGGFIDERLNNVINANKLLTTKPLYNIQYFTGRGGLIKLTMYHAWDKEGTKYNWLTTTKEGNNKPVFVFDYNNYMRIKGSHLMDFTALELIVDGWKKDHIKTDNITSYETIIGMLATAKKQIDRRMYNIEEVENIF